MSADTPSPNPPAGPVESRSVAGFWSKYKSVIMPLATALSAALIGSILTYVGAPPKVVETITEVIKVVETPAPDAAPPEGASGWVNDAEAIRAAADELPTRVFADTPAGQTRDLPPSVYLWQLYRKLTGRDPPLKDQNPTGSCVGFGNTTAIERTLAADIAQRGGDASEFTLFSEEVTYAGSRVEANGGKCPIRPTRLDPYGDGSNGSWAAKWATKWGMVPKGKYGSLDLTEYSASRARAWNYSGVPDELEPVARKFPVKDATRIANWTDAKRALANGYGIGVCSSQGFVRQRDANGVAKPGPSWAHCMCLDGYHVEGGREYGHIENSWAKTNYHVGPVGWGAPTTAGFWAESEVIDRMLRQGDSWAYSGAVGFPRKVIPVDWFVNAAPARRVRDLAVAADRFALAP